MVQRLYYLYHFATFFFLVFLQVITTVLRQIDDLCFSSLQVALFSSLSPYLPDRESSKHCLSKLFIHDVCGGVV